MSSLRVRLEKVYGGAFCDDWDFESVDFLGRGFIRANFLGVDL